MTNIKKRRMEERSGERRKEVWKEEQTDFKAIEKI